jgi:hypothetical protein
LHLTFFFFSFALLFSLLLPICVPLSYPGNISLEDLLWLFRSRLLSFPLDQRPAVASVQHFRLFTDILAVVPPPSTTAAICAVITAALSETVTAAEPPQINVTYAEQVVTVQLLRILLDCVERGSDHSGREVFTALFCICSLPTVVSEVISDTRYFTTFAKQVEHEPTVVRLSWLGLLWLSLLTSSSIYPPVPIPDNSSPSHHIVPFMMDIIFQCRPFHQRAALPVDLTALCRIPIVTIASRLVESSSLSALDARNVTVTLWYLRKDQPVPAEFSVISPFAARLMPVQGSHGKCVPYATTMFADHDFRFEANTLKSNEITRDSDGTIVLYPSLTPV